MVSNGNKIFINKLNKVTDKVSDLRPIFLSIQKDWYETNKNIVFSSTNSNLFKDLSEKYKEIKRRRFGNIYPILVREYTDNTKTTPSGRLRDSLVGKNKNSIFKLSTKKMTLGTDIRYAKVLRDGFDVYLPARNFMDLEIADRRSKYIGWIKDYVIDGIRKGLK